MLSPYIAVHLIRTARKTERDKRWKMNLQFADAINCLSAALEAGYSVENALREAYSDMLLTYSEGDMIMTELRTIIKRTQNNVAVEESFLALGRDTGIEDISSFADIFATAKRTGGNIISIIRTTASVTRTRIELKRELQAAIAAKKYESDIMKLIPFAILLYLRVFSPDMIAYLYTAAGGRVFMTAVLVLYIVLCLISDRMVRIEL